MLLGLIGLAVFVVSLAVSTALTVAFLVRLPADYFTRDTSNQKGRHALWLHWLRFSGKNLLALLVVAIGIVLSLPGVPGQGLLTILLGIMISDFPGKQKLERKIVGIPAVLSAINRLRARFQKQPLEL